jgi:hypothetical protein
MFQSMHVPWTIWRQALVEMCKLCVLTTAVLVTVVSFALTVKFFAEGRLGPLETLHFMVLAMVPMLQYTVPFSACFAATMVYHRMAADNEITAAQAGGISHRSLLVPAVISGLVLAACISLLTEQIVPRFLWKMEDLVSQKVAKIVMSSIERRQPIQQNGTMVYADEAVMLPPDEAGGASDAMRLFGIVVVRYDEKGAVDFEAAARQAVVQVYPGQGTGGRDGNGERGSTMVVVSLKDAAGKTDGKRFSGDVTRAFTIPGGVEDDPKFFTWGGLRALRHEPERINYMDRMRRDLAYHLGERAACAALKDALNSDKRATLVSPGGDLFVVEARDIRYGPSSRKGGADRWELAPGASGQILVDRFGPGPNGQRGAGPVTHFEARTGGVATNMGEEGAIRLSIDLQLEDVSSTTGAERAAGELADQTFAGLSLQEDPLPELLSKTSAQLLAIAGPRTTGPNADPFLKPPARDLRNRIAQLMREVTSKQHERMAMAAAGLVMIVTGAVTALRLRGRLPLTVYLWSFFPALACVLTISSGQQMVEPMGNIGLLLLWGGVAGLAAYSVYAYRVVCRH